MRYVELFETPIENLEVHGMDQPGSFPDADRRLLSRPEHIEKIRKRFAKTPYFFDLYFVNRQLTKPYINKDGKFSAKWSNDLDKLNGINTPKAVHRLTNLNIEPLPDAITVVFTSNANQDETINMTPWIVAHRLAHALLDGNDRMPPLLINLRILLSQYDQVAGTPMYLLMTMRSARENRLLEGEELPEMFAQYILQGKVVLDRPRSGWFNDMVERTEAKLNDYIDQYLKACVGKLFISL